MLVRSLSRLDFVGKDWFVLDRGVRSAMLRLIMTVLVAVLIVGEVPWVIAAFSVASAEQKGGARQRATARQNEDKRETQKARKQRKQKRPREAGNRRETEKSSQPQDVIVVLKRHNDPEQIAEEVGADPTQVYDHVLNGFAAEVSPAELAELEALPEVAAVVPDYPIEAFTTEIGFADRVGVDAHNVPKKCKKIDDRGKRKKCLERARKRGSQSPPPASPSAGKTVAPAPSNQPDQLIPTGVDRIDAEPLAVAGTARDGMVGVDVAVLDTGIAAHPDLSVVGGVSCVPNHASTADDNGHGTHVAGTIAALDNAIGVVGVAPGARLWPIKVLDAQGNGSWSSVICGLDEVYKARDKIDVVNLSLGGDGTDSPCNADGVLLHDVICKVVIGAGIPVVVAAGNSRQDASEVVPAAYDEVITVSAFADFDGVPGGLGAATCGNGRDDTFASFSNYGPDVDIAAPGVCIRSTEPGGGYAVLSGTSMAAPHVTGAVARYLAENPAATPDDVRAWLLSTASRPQGSASSFTDDGDTSPEPVLYLGLA